MSDIVKYKVEDNHRIASLKPIVLYCPLRPEANVNNNYE